jgi:AcrR family transcriptional regulator
MASSGVYGGVPADERRAQRRERLLEAGLEIMGTRGWAHMSVRGVCREARLTSRFFYESFEDLDALAVAIFDDIQARASARVLEAITAAGPDPRAQARAAIGTFVHELTDDPRRGRVAVVEALSCEPLMRRRLEAMDTMARLIADLGRATYRPPPQAETLVDVTATLLAGGIAELLVAWLNGSLEIGREALIEDCAALVMATVEGATAIGRARAGRR